MLLRPFTATGVVLWSEAPEVALQGNLLRFLWNQPILPNFWGNVRGNTRGHCKSVKMQSTQGSVSARIKGESELCVSPLQWVRISWNLFKKWRSKVAPSQTFPSAFLWLWHHPLVIGMGRRRQKVIWLVSEWQIQGQHCDQSPVTADSPALCLTHPCAVAGNSLQKPHELLQLSGAWLMVTLHNCHGHWKFTLGDFNMFAAHFIATCDKGDGRSAFQKIGCSYLLTKHSAVKLAQSHGPYKYRVPLPALPQTIFILHRYFRRFAGADSPQPTGSNEVPLPACRCFRPPLPGCSRWEAE